MTPGVLYNSRAFHMLSAIQMEAEEETEAEKKTVGVESRRQDYQSLSTNPCKKNLKS